MCIRDRFNIYRIAGNHLLNNLSDMALKWEQSTTCKIVDAMHQKDNVRMYKIPLKKGNNTIYFLSEKEPFQLDIVDPGINLIISQDSRERSQSIDIKSMNNSYCYIRVYPSSRKRYSMYAIIGAEGRRIVPHFIKIAILVSIALSAVLVLLFLKFLDGKKYSGISRLK